MSTTNLQGYSILEPVGEGTLGTVYRAHDSRGDRVVALRILSGDIRWDAELRGEVHRVCETLSGLRHPNIAQLYEFGEEAGSTFVATEFVEGENLRRVAADASLPVEKRIALMQQLAAGLGHAHDNGILHRDLRPEDIFVCPDGTIKIVDLSLSQVLARALTRPALRWGTPLYLAPEQIGEKHYDTRSEIFVAGMIFYELLTGTHPFQDGNSNRVLDNILSEECLPGFEPFEDAPPGLGHIVEKCLAKEPDERFQRMDEVAAECVDLLDDIARECHAMLVELQVAVPRLRRAAGRREAPGELSVLLGEIQKVVAGEQGRDYATLDGLMSRLAAQNAVIYSILGRRRGTKPPPESTAPERREAPSEKAGPSLAGRLDDRGGAEAAPLLPPQAIDQPVMRASVPPNTNTGPELEPGAPLSLDLQELAFLESSVPGDGTPRPQPAVADGRLPGETRVPVEREIQAELHGPVLSRHSWFARPAVWAAVLAFLALAAASVWVLRSGFVARAMSGLDASSPGHLGGAPVAPPAPVPAAVADSDNPAATADLLVRQAETMAVQGRSAEARLFLNRALELEPEYATARALRDRLEATESARQGDAEALGKQITAATTLITAGQLRKARVEINRIAASNPDHPALTSLRRSWDAKNAELSRESERKKTEQAEAARLASVEEAWTRRTGDLFRAGKYAEVQRAVNEWLTANPGSTQAESVRTRAAECQQLIAVVEPAIADRRYPDATVALARLESLNPSDPALAAQRRVLEARKTAARAFLSVHRLAEPGVVLFDGFPIGSAGEIDAAPVSIGEHSVSVKTTTGAALSLIHDFSDGEKAVFVYDARALRPASGSDAAALASRRAREQVYRLAVEHSHGLLRGSCSGALLVSGLEVRYEPASGSHGFNVPFPRLKLKVQGRTVELRFASDSAPFHSFKARAAADGEALQQAWSRLEKAAR